MKTQPFENLSKNEVILVGRMRPIFKEQELPSGDRILEFRIVVDRHPENSASNSKSRVPGKKAPSQDTIDVAVWKLRLQKRVRSIEVGEWVEVKGSLRRRFWMGSTGITSRWQVEASDVRSL